jgi:neutral ceramidase
MSDPMRTKTETGGMLRAGNTDEFTTHRNPCNRRAASRFVLALALACGPVVALPQDTDTELAEWKVGLAMTVITPEQPVRMAGYAARVKPFERVEQDLFAKALALEDATGRRAVLVTTDLIGLSAGLLEPVCNRIRERTGLGREQLLFSASHTHAGPALSLEVNPASAASVEDAGNTAAYTRGLQDKLIGVVERALAGLQKGRLSWGVGVVHFPMNRREFTDTGIILGVNPKGPADRSVPVLRVDDSAGRTRAVLFGCACHCTTLTGDNYAVSGDYAGFAQALVQQRFPDAQAMFMAGCGGDANPYPRGTMELARRHGTELGTEVVRVAEGSIDPVRGPLRLGYRHTSLPLRSVGRGELETMAESGPSWQRGTARRLLEMLDRGEAPPTAFRGPVAVWQFGSDLTLVGLSGEAVVDYVHLLEQALGPMRLWVAAYCNDYFGYLPSDRVLEEGGYETRGLFDGRGWFAPGTQAALVETVRSLAQQMGRPLPQ